MSLFSMHLRKNAFILLLFGICIACCVSSAASSSVDETKESQVKDKVKVFTVATEETDGYQRYLRSARVYDIPVTTLGLGEKWLGGDMQDVGGGFKINLLRKAIEPIKDEKDTIIIFTDSYDVVFTSGLADVLKKFKETNAKILFSAEKYCWPDASLEAQYPEVPPKASRFLNSGAFMGYAPQIYALLKTPIKDNEDDQLYYTKVFLDTKSRKELGMQLDVKSQIFQNLNGAKDDVKLSVDLDSNQGELKNLNFLTLPNIIHGNGPSKVDLNAYSNYLAKTFSDKCLICEENRAELDENNLPTITLAIMITIPVPFFDRFLEKIEKLNYPKNKIHLFMYSNVEFHDDMAKSFVRRLEKEYKSTKEIFSHDQVDERRARELSVAQAMLKQSDYFFNVDADVHIDDPETLRELLITNKQFVAPVVSRNYELWSNFWGALAEGGYYARSHDYVDIVKHSFAGMWNVPYVSSIYLIRASVLKHINYQHQYFDPDMALCDSLRNSGIFMYIINAHNHGHLVNPDKFDITVVRPDFYTLFTNRNDWMAKYIHPNYVKQLEENATMLQPCPDVYWFQIATDDFCDDMVAIMEGYGKWSDGTNSDKRLEGGYEAVPTRDIHMKQVGLDPMWLQFLQLFVRPLQEKAFTGYYHNPPRSLMNFVVRYRPDEQPFLRPHHDSSTYTINIALNTAGKDFEGGGCRFIRYNCSVTDTRKGWLLMHPGRLTHFHEGLYVTNGTRYIMISFIDP